MKAAKMIRYVLWHTVSEVKCNFCGETSELISKELRVCGSCLREKPQEAKVYIEKAHAKSKGKFDLPASPPKDPNGVKCTICVNQCMIGEGQKGFCGLRTNQKGKLVHLGGTPSKGIVSWYFDPLPTNCVADWVCPGGSECGYPKYSYSPGVEYGYKNLAVFLGACSFDCLFCQNWHYREMTRTLFPIMTAQELADCVDDKTSCICYFGGDPTPQLPFAIKASKIALKQNEDRILRICWETNGTMNPSLARKMAELSLNSGGCIKFDLKAWDENLNIALTGITNRQTLQNFEMLAQFIAQRPESPFLVASTLLVPGYIDAQEVFNIAKFIAGLDPNIPYSLLAFYPCFQMMDMPTTSRKQALECREAALEVGLKRVKIGNIHLLS
ncbi:MAG: radical SAM protein [Actinomycetota bacterium]|nr:radical SAM protein [Actinomycetota bacterium]